MSVQVFTEEDGSRWVREEDYKREVFIPGMWRCARCNFVLVQSNLNAKTGSVTARDEPGEKCPNDGAPLWRMTWRESEHETAKRATEQMLRASEAEEKLAKAEAKLAALSA